MYLMQNEIYTLPPIFTPLANALYKATGKRVYRQPFFG